MDKSKPYLAISLSVLINCLIIYSLQTSHKNIWELSQSELSIGNNLPSLLENMTLSSKPTKHEVVPKALIPQKPVDKVIKHETNKVPAKIVKVIEPTIIKQPTIQEKPTMSKIEPKKATETTEASPETQANVQIKQKAKLRSSPPPLAYPREAVKQNITGKVILQALVDIEGKISEIKILVSSGYSVLDEAAIKWFEQLRFNPANDGKAAISSKVSQTISFNLKDLQAQE